MRAWRSLQLRWGLTLLTGAALLIAFAPAPAATTTPTDRYFHVQASTFAYAPAVLRVNPGDRVTIDLAATDVVHGLALDGYGLSVISEPGHTTRLTFVADRSGTFRLRCSVTCGPLHPFMIGKLEVGSNALFWRAAGLSLLAVLAGLVWARPAARRTARPAERTA